MTVVDTMAGRLAQIQQRIADACARAGRAPGSVVLLPVSKTFDVDAIREAMALGLNRFGENKTQEIRQKAAALAGQGLEFVLIGHLQTNKSKDAARDATEVQSLDRPDLAEALHRRLLNEGRTLDVLVQLLPADATERLQEAIDRFDFDQAGVQLQQLRKHWLDEPLENPA